jgi:hypothetical protein
VKLLASLTDVFRTGSFAVTSPEKDAGVIRTVVFINGDVITTVCNAAREPKVVEEHFRKVEARGQAVRNRLRLLRIGAFTLWALVALGTAVRSSLVATGVVLASALVTAALRWIHVPNPRIRVLVDLLKIALLSLLALLSTLLGYDQIAIGSKVAAALDLVLFLALAVGRLLVRRAILKLGVLS